MSYQLSNQTIIILSLVLMMCITLIVDGAFGERAFGMLLAGFGLILGYFFRKEQETKRK